MTKRVPLWEWMLVLAAVFAFGVVAWLNSGPIGNIGAWFAVIVAIGWPMLAYRAPCRAKIDSQ